ncbi:hypothetical protein MIZ03_3970 [Rhodoferax lithotrophicus]|uniref:Uncharacterized protein n=1 Tax=Rhodoferax lithotrophicus TaxID=2798804 RepID=A0ABN6DBE1_9BURK|nr:hypothetical protein MIZ03_3970 [Rhodoferax sp. MIZ03]
MPPCEKLDVHVSRQADVCRMAERVIKHLYAAVRKQKSLSN